MDEQNSSSNWCEDFDQVENINRPGSSDLKQSTGHFLISGMKFKSIDFTKDTFTDDNIVLTDSYDVLTNSDIDSMTVLDNQTTDFGIAKHSQNVMLPEYRDISEVETMVSMPEEYFQNDLYHLKSNNISQVSNTHSVMENLSHDNNLGQMDQLSFIPKQTNNFVNNLGHSQEDMVMQTGNKRFIFSENGGSYIEVSLKENDVLNNVNNDENEFYVPQSSSVQENHIAQKIVSIDELSLLPSPKSHHNVDLLVNHEELVDDIDTCDIAVVDESQIPLNSGHLKDRIDEESESVSLDVDHHSSGFQRMSKETIEKIAEEFVRQPQCIDEDISINFVSRLNLKPPAQIEYWCEDCNKLYHNESSCPVHQVSSIIDIAVQTRARASLPATHLKIMKIKDQNNLNIKFGVFARKTIQKRTQFGPLEGVVVKDEECSEDPINNEFKYLLEVDKQFRRIDVSSEDNTNWMSFVRPAKTKQEQNMIVDQIGDHLFFTTTRSIFQQEELFVGYSTFYAHKRGLNLLPSIENNHGIFPLARKPGKAMKNISLMEISHKQQPDNNLRVNFSNKATNTVRSTSSLATCKHMTEKRKLSSRFGKTNSQCNLCVNVQNNSRNAYRMKLRSSVIRNIWVCEGCDLKFTKQDTIVIHRKLHEDEFDLNRVTLTNKNCPECNARFDLNEELIKHVSLHSSVEVKVTGGQIVYNCYQCDNRYKNALHLKAHQAKHKVNELKPFKCTMCTKRFLNSSGLDCHTRIHFEGKIYNCPICRLTFVDLKSMQEHIHSHAVNDIFYCPLCPMHFTSYYSIRRHIRGRHHSDLFECEFCQSSFKTQCNLDLHKLKHSDSKNFLCNMCGKQYKRKDKLKIHMNKSHYNKKKPSKTQIKLEAIVERRRQKFVNFGSSKSMLEYKRSVHKCDHCLLGFKRRGAFVNHLVLRHPEISLDSIPSLNQPTVAKTIMYMCLHCDKAYKTNAKRKSHMLKNHPDCILPEKPTEKTVVIDDTSSDQAATNVGSQVHNCQWCYKQYALKNKLLKHQRTHHYHLLPPCLQEPRTKKRNKDKAKDPEPSTSKSLEQQLNETIDIQFTGTDGFELEATDVQLHNAVELGGIVAFKRPPKTKREIVVTTMRFAAKNKTRKNTRVSNNDVQRWSFNRYGTIRYDANIKNYDQFGGSACLPSLPLSTPDYTTAHLQGQQRVRSYTASLSSEFESFCVLLLGGNGGISRTTSSSRLCAVTCYCRLRRRRRGCRYPFLN
ncbi:Hypothetical protein CINCED_3A002479 [Cinara cedri]|uniref:Zinc finger C2H2-type,Zinc finger, RING/FYVE/PHD-type n=1 Tax=Cinara cedri TaxID=506608 RepID=A0A5E4N6E7_9HEMI|nr:Hypothetical protein CINCED_3A002479 [Cinara cedri]